VGGGTLSVIEFSRLIPDEAAAKTCSDPQYPMPTTVVMQVGGGQRARKAGYLSTYDRGRVVA